MYKVVIVACAAAMLIGCGGDASGSTQSQAGWTTGFWFWQGSSNAVGASVPVDVIYVHTGNIWAPHHGRQRWGVSSQLPPGLPEAR